jgi:hypothetical protein
MSNMSDQILFRCRGSEEAGLMPAFLEAMKSKDAAVLAGLLVAGVANRRGMVDLDEYGKICFGVTIKWVAQRLCKREHGELLQIYARIIKPLESPKGGLRLQNAVVLKNAVERYFTEVLQ